MVRYLDAAAYGEFLDQDYAEHKRLAQKKLTSVDVVKGVVKGVALVRASERGTLPVPNC